MIQRLIGRRMVCISNHNSGRFSTMFTGRRPVPAVTANPGGTPAGPAVRSVAWCASMRRHVPRDDSVLLRDQRTPWGMGAAVAGSAGVPPASNKAGGTPALPGEGQRRLLTLHQVQEW